MHVMPIASCASEQSENFAALICPRAFPRHSHTAIEDEVRQSGPPRIARSVLMGQPTNRLFETSFDRITIPSEKF